MPMRGLGFNEPHYGISRIHLDATRVGKAKRNRRDLATPPAVAIDPIGLGQCVCEARGRELVDLEAALVSNINLDL